MTSSTRASGVVALETTLLLHGVPAVESLGLARRLRDVVAARGAEARLVGVYRGRAVSDLSMEQLGEMLKQRGGVAKVNTGNLGVRMFRKEHAATTVATTMEIAAGAGIGMFATGGLGGVHEAEAGGVGSFDVSADLTALTRFPVCVVCSGVKSILDVRATREMLETLGVPVVGYQTEEFPCFYLRRHPEGGVNKCDARFDDAGELARFIRFELARTNRGVVVCNPIPIEHEIAASDWQAWLGLARHKVAASGASGRDATPALLAGLHEVSEGATLRANIELAASNADLAALLATEMS